MAAERVERAGRWGPWLWSPAWDVTAFGGSALLALALVAFGQITGLSERAFPDWAWLACVLAVDVAHVYATWFRTYLDGAELRRHPLRYAGWPLALYALMVALYAQGPQAFWRTLAYVAVFHFVRQQVGWVAVYRARSPRSESGFERVLDDGAVYAATLYPIVAWHARLGDRRFDWFVAGDFVASPMWKLLEPLARWAWVVALSTFALYQLQKYVRERTLALGKCLVVGSTAVIWYVGIVATNSDFDFTVTNVLAHGVPYLALLWFYARARAERQDPPAPVVQGVVRGGLVAFLGCLLLLAFIEEMAWDRWVWGDRAWLFGEGEGLLDEAWLVWIVPLLSLPQVTHYALDGVLWRRRETASRPAQRRALGSCRPAREGGPNRAGRPGCSRADPGESGAVP